MVSSHGDSVITFVNVLFWQLDLCHVDLIIAIEYLLHFRSSGS